MIFAKNHRKSMIFKNHRNSMILKNHRISMILKNHQISMILKKHRTSMNENHRTSNNIELQWFLKIIDLQSTTLVSRIVHNTCPWDNLDTCPRVNLETCPRVNLEICPKDNLDLSQGQTITLVQGTIYVACPRKYLWRLFQGQYDACPRDNLRQMPAVFDDFSGTIHDTGPRDNPCY